MVQVACGLQEWPDSHLPPPPHFLPGRSGQGTIRGLSLRVDPFAASCVLCFEVKEFFSNFGTVTLAAASAPDPLGKGVDAVFVDPPL